MSKLSQAQKYAIQGAIHDGKTPTEIAKIVKSTIPVVERYINGELTDIQNTIAKVQTEQVMKAAEDPKTPPPAPVKKLAKGYSKGQFALKPADQKSSSNDGYAIMTPNASAAGDDFNKQLPKTVSRTARNAIFRADTGEKIEE